MIIGIGIDIVEIGRIKTAVERELFVRRIFTKNEQVYCQNRGVQRYASYAARFAAKEAVMKAFGTGMAGGSWQDIDIIIDQKGAPHVVLSGEFAMLAKQLKVLQIHISLTHAREYAAAQVLLWGGEKGMKVVTANEMREIDRLAIEEYGIPGVVLMENAGVAVERSVREAIGNVADKKICIFAGRGNNGGDGYVAARHLHNQGAKVKVFLVSTTDQVVGDAKINLDIICNMGIDVFEVVGERDFDKMRIAVTFSDCLVDALLGTGFKGEVHGVMLQIVELINTAGKMVIAVDIPSGVNADTGQVNGIAVQADHTITLGLPKLGLLLYPGAFHAGRVRIADLGFPITLLTNESLKQHIITATYVRQLLVKRPPEAHKGTCGRVLLVAGSKGFTGAAALAATAAMRSGAGLVTLGIAESLHSIMEVKLTEVMTKPLPETGEGAITGAALPVIEPLAHQSDVLAIGPGLGRHEETLAVVREMVKSAPCPLVIDADGLYALGEETELLTKSTVKAILTPHPGEMSRLIALPIEDINADRVEAARLAASEWGSIIVLKGAPTIVACPSGEVYVNTTGNAGMATGGTGDVLTGVIAAFIAQGLSSYEAAIAGVYVHGLAGDIQAESGMIGMMAGDLLSAIPAAIHGIQEK